MAQRYAAADLTWLDTCSGDRPTPTARSVPHASSSTGLRWVLRLSHTVTIGPPSCRALS